MSDLRRIVESASRRSQRGQGMSEYLIITALIAVAAIGVFAFFGDAVTSQMSAMTQEIAGQAGDNSGADTAANSAVAQGNQVTTLDNYMDNGQN